MLFERLLLLGANTLHLEQVASTRMFNQVSAGKRFEYDFFAGRKNTAVWLAYLVSCQSIVGEARVRFPVGPTLRVLK